MHGQQNIKIHLPGASRYLSLYILHSQHVLVLNEPSSGRLQELYLIYFSDVVCIMLAWRLASARASWNIKTEHYL